MNREKMTKESKDWVKENIITEAQRQQIIERYPKKQNRSILFTFAAIFIGLGFLTFIASNWSEMDDLFRMGLILGCMLLFYIAGEIIYDKKSKAVGVSFLLIALLIFGSGIFLTGQMYHYTFFSALPFFLWALAGYCLYWLFKDRTLFAATLVIITVGQLYGGVVYQDYHLWMAFLFIFGLGWVVCKEGSGFTAVWFGVSYLIQSLVLVFSEGIPYYWLLVLFLLLYVANDLLRQEAFSRSFKTLSVMAVFIFNIFEVFLLGNERMDHLTDSSFSFFIIWAVLFVITVIRSALRSMNYDWIDLFLFVPVFRFAFGDVLSLTLLFIYSLLWLIFGYQKEIRGWVNKGTIAFLFTTFLAYFQLAWDFMDRSVFFFTGGILLFGLSYLLERKRRGVEKGGPLT